MTAMLPKPHAARQRDALTLDLVRDEAGFFALEPFWDVLVDQMATRSPFLRWDWMRLWWEECGTGAQLVIAVLRDVEGVPQAIAPLMLARENDLARRHLVTLAFLGGFGDAHGERLDFIVPAGREDDLAPRLCGLLTLLREECDIVRLNFLPQESANTPHILAALEKTFVRAGVLNRHPSRVITLPSSWQEIEARHSAGWRSNLRRRSKAFAVRHMHWPVHAFDELCRLHACHFSAEVSSFTHPASIRFHRRLAECWMPQGRAIMPMLESGGAVVAAIYGFIERDEFFQYQMGWDDTFTRLSPGRVVLRSCIVESIRLGLRAFDMLPGDYEYKRQWSDATRWLLDLEAHNPSSWRASTFHALRAVRRRLASNPLPEALAA